MNRLTIRLETEKDHPIVENLIREAFWNVYKPGCDEHYYAHMLRRHRDFVPELAFVLEQDGQIIGSILYSKTRLVDETGNEKQILSFGPIAVLPQYQRRGCSRLLIDHSFAQARTLGYDTVVILGNPANYVGRGFVSCKKLGVTYYGRHPTSLLVRELIPGALEDKTWEFLDSDAGACCEDADALAAFDALFPPREKSWMPSQEEFYIYSHSCIVP